MSPKFPMVSIGIPKLTVAIQACKSGTASFFALHISTVYIYWFIVVSHLASSSSMKLYIASFTV